MSHDSNTELPRRSAADQNTYINGACDWSGMQQLSKDEKKFFTDLNNVMVDNNQLPKLELTGRGASSSGQNKWISSHHDGDHNECDGHRDHGGHNDYGDHNGDREPQNVGNHDRNGDQNRRGDRDRGSHNSGGEHRDSGNHHNQWKNSRHNFTTNGPKDGIGSDCGSKPTIADVTKELNQDITNIATDLKAVMPSSPMSDELISSLQKLADSTIAELMKKENPESGPPSQDTNGHPLTSGEGAAPTNGDTSGSAEPTGGGRDTSGGAKTSSGGGDNGGAGNSGTETGTGKFVVKNGRLYDPNGKEFLPNGLNVDSRQAMNETDQLVNQYHFNFLRIGFNGMVSGDGSPNFNTMDALANKYSKLGVPIEFEYPIVDDQSVLTGASLQKSENWYSQVAEHFKNNPYIFLATPNESGDGTTNNQGWVDQTKGILTAIANTGNENPVVIDDTHWSGAAVQGDPTKSGLIKYADQFHTIDPNLIAAEHDYSHDSETQAAEYLRRGISALQSAGYNPFVQEFGPYNFGGPSERGGGVDAVLSKETMESGVGYNAYLDTFGYSAATEKALSGPLNQDAAILPDGSLSNYGKQIVAQNQVDQQYLNSH